MNSVSLPAMNAGSTSIGQVNGQPALVVEPDTDATGANPACVEFDLNGTDVSLYSSSYGTDTLLEIADSM
jgi:hypothetical protein